jgi:hypothetical protein
MLRSLGLMAITFFCSIGIALAQQAPTSPISPEVLGKLLPQIAPEGSMGTLKGAPIRRNVERAKQFDKWLFGLSRDKLRLGY